MSEEHRRAARFNELPEHVQHWLGGLSEVEVARINDFFKSYERAQWVGRSLWRLAAWGIAALIAMAAMGDAVSRIWDGLLHLARVR